MQCENCEGQCQHHRGDEMEGTLIMTGIIEHRNSQASQLFGQQSAHRLPGGGWNMCSLDRYLHAGAENIYRYRYLESLNNLNGRTRQKEINPVKYVLQEHEPSIRLLLPLLVT